MNRFGEILHKGWRGAKDQAAIILAGVVLFVLSFLLGLHLFFPVAAVQQWLVTEIDARTPVSVQFEKLSLKPLFTLYGRDALVSFDNSTQSPLILDEIRLRPLWTTLVTGDPDLLVEASALQGQIKADLRRSGALALHLQGVQLKAFPVNPETNTLLSGTIVKGELRGSSPARKNGENHLLLEMNDASLNIMGQPLPLGKISVQGNGQGNNLRITTLTASGGEIAISGTGTMLLGASAAASRINLDLTLRPSSSAPPALTALLDLAARRQTDGGYRLRLNGSPSQLTIEQLAPALEQTGVRQNQEDDG